MSRSSNINLIVRDDGIELLLGFAETADIVKDNLGFFVLLGSFCDPDLDGVDDCQRTISVIDYLYCIVHTRDYYFRPDIERWQEEGRVASVQTAFSRVPDGGGYVQDALRRDAERVRRLVAQGALVRVCGSRPMAHGVAETLDQILGALRLSVAQLKAKGRYAEDVF